MMTAPMNISFIGAVVIITRSSGVEEFKSSDNSTTC